MRPGADLWLIAAAIALLGACTATSEPKSAAQMAERTSASVEDLAAAVAADAQQSDAASDAKTREQLAADAEDKAQACLRLAPQAAACLYYRGIAMGLEARAHPLRANESLKSMLESLAEAQQADAQYDMAGPDRVTALVLLRAPGWPLGPGDPDAGLTAARHAVQLQPLYPPNQLALAEALSKTGDAAGARTTFQRARDLVQAGQGKQRVADQEAWIKQADEGLRR